MRLSEREKNLFEGLMIQGCSLGQSESFFRCSGESSHRNDSAKLNLPLLIETSSFVSSSSAILSCGRRRHPIYFANLSYFSINPNLTRGSQEHGVDHTTRIRNPEAETTIRSLYCNVFERKVVEEGSSRELLRSFLPS